MKKLMTLLFSILLVLTLCSCGKKTLNDDIYIVYTNDVHCQTEGEIGYAGLSALAKELKNEHEYVTVVDCGDYIQGGAAGSFTKGSSIITYMNNIYDLATFGNHEFDYGIERLKEIIESASFDFVLTNVEYSGTKTNIFENVPRYVIKEYGDYKIGYIGVLTPTTIITSTPSYFKEGDEYVYNFYNEGQAFYDCIQKTVDELKNDKKVDYVIVLSHLGIAENTSPFTSRELIGNTSGIDAVLDGHSHDVILEEHLNNKDGKDVLLSSTGTQFENVGLLTISKEGLLQTVLFDTYEAKDEEVIKMISDDQVALDEQLSEVIGHSSFDMKIVDENGVRISRNREIALGDFVADAYRAIYQTDVAFVNAGGIRSDLLAGDISKKDVYDVAAFLNSNAVCLATGQEIVDALEFTSRNARDIIVDGDGNKVGENGGFLQVSGLKFDLCLSMESSVSVDENGFFKAVEGPRRVSNVYILEGEEYVPIDLNKTYTVASSAYVLMEAGDGNNIFQDNEFIITYDRSDMGLICEYITDCLNGEIPEAYSKIQNRINFIVN